MNILGSILRRVAGKPVSRIPVLAEKMAEAIGAGEFEECDEIGLALVKEAVRTMHEVALSQAGWWDRWKIRRMNAAELSQSLYDICEMEFRFREHPLPFQMRKIIASVCGEYALEVVR